MSARPEIAGAFGVGATVFAARRHRLDCASESEIADGASRHEAARTVTRC